MNVEHRTSDVERRTVRFDVRRSLVFALLCFVFSHYARQPLYHTDLWGHLAYGRLICRTRAIPETEPFMPLARGVPLVDSAWLSQVAAYGAYATGGAAALQAVHAALIAGCVAMIAWCLRRQKGRLPGVAVGLAAFVALGWFQVRIARPQTAGLVCFVALVMTVSAMRWRRWHWIAIPSLFAVWANLHGSFVMGLGWLACLCAGRMFDVVRRTRSLSAPLRDRVARRLA